MRIRWNNTATGTEGYEIQHSIDGVRWPEDPGYPRIPSPNQTENSAEDSSLPPATRHYYRVRVFNQAGDSAFSNVASAFTWATLLPPEPTSLVANATSSSTIHLSFVDNSNASRNEEVFLFSMSYDGGANWQTDFANSIFSDVDVIEVPPGTQVKFRVRATNVINGTRYYSAYSNVASATTFNSNPNVLRIYNGSSYPLISLVVDGVEYYQQAPLGLAPGNYLELLLPQGAHTYATRSGFWRGDGTRHPMYTTSGTAASGQTVTISNPSIGGMLTRFSSNGSVGYWVGNYYEGTFPRSQAFCFSADGRWRFYRDGNYTGQDGQAQTIYYPIPGNFSVRFQLSPNQEYIGFIDESTTPPTSFGMKNGPIGWEWIQYSSYSERATCPS